MYTPKNFLIDNKAEAVSFMQRYSFATLVTVATGIPSATHLPFLVSLRDDQIVLSSHFAKANPQADELLNGNPLVIFAEPHAYISPKHYDQANSVPTWNYIAVHAYGIPTLIDSVEGKISLLERTINYYEAEYLQQWKSLPTDFKSKMMNGITGFEITVTELQGKKKLSQNKTDIERNRIVDTLSAATDSNEKAIAEYMKMLKK